MGWWSPLPFGRGGTHAGKPQPMSWTGSPSSLRNSSSSFWTQSAQVKVTALVDFAGMVTIRVTGTFETPPERRSRGAFPLVAGEVLTLRPLGYEPTDVRLRCLGQSLVTALTSADLRREVVPGLLHLSRLSLSRCVRFTNRFTEPVLDLWLSALPRGENTRAPACRFTPSPSAARTSSGPEPAVLQTTTHRHSVSVLTWADGVA